MLTPMLEQVLLRAFGMDGCTQYLARRTVQLWMGISLPGGEVVVMMESAADGLPAQWESERRQAVFRIISGTSVGNAQQESDG